MIERPPGIVDTNRAHPIIGTYYTCKLCRQEGYRGLDRYVRFPRIHYYMYHWEP